MVPSERLVSTAQSQVGYMGKKTNNQLDDFKTNSPGLYNKYARDLDALGDWYNGKKNGYDWCDVFVDWCFYKTFGKDLALKLTCQPLHSLGAGTKYSMNYYKNKGQLYTNDPQPGDQIFFNFTSNPSTVSHTGLVEKVVGNYVYTIEGNSGNPSAVRGCRYPLTYKSIVGYGRPNWNIVISEDDNNNSSVMQPETNITEQEDDDMKYYKTLKDVPSSYQPTIKKLMEKGALKGRSDPNPNTLDDNVLEVSEDYCRIMTTLDRLGKLD